jgi:hypothetical protein
MSIEFKLFSATEEDKNIWDHFVSHSYNGTIFHKSFWLDAWGGSYDIWVLYQGDDLIAGFVAPFRKILGAKIISPPFHTQYSGLVLKKYEGKYVNKISAEKALTMELAAFLKKRYKWGILSFDPLIMDMHPFMLHGFEVIPRYTYIVDISDIKKTWEEVERKKRNHIRKAEKDGLIIVEPSSFDEVIQLVGKSYRRQNMKFPSYQYYDELKKRNLCKSFLCVNGNGDKIATSLIIWDEKKVYGRLQGYDSEKKHTGASSLCIWECLKFASKELGFREFDCGGGSMNPQFEEPIKKLGGKLTPYYEVRWGRGLDLMLKIRLFFSRYFNI